MGRRRNPIKFLEKNNEEPGVYYWKRFWSAKYPEDPSTLGPFAYNMYSSLEPLEQVYIGKLKAAFDLWFDMIVKSPFAASTTLQRMFFDEIIRSCILFEGSHIAYDMFFKFIFEVEICREDIVESLNQLLADDAVTYTNFFEVSCLFYMIATRHFADENFDIKEVQFFRAMFEAINALNTFTCKHETYLKEKNEERHTAASRKGGENRWSRIRDEVTRLLKEEIGTDQGLKKWDRPSLTEHLLPKVEGYISINDIKSPPDLFSTIENWSLAPRSDIAMLYDLLLE